MWKRHGFLSLYLESQFASILYFLEFMFLRGSTNSKRCYANKYAQFISILYFLEILMNVMFDSHVFKQLEKLLGKIYKTLITPCKQISTFYLHCIFLGSIGKITQKKKPWWTSCVMSYLVSLAFLIITFILIIS